MPKINPDLLPDPERKQKTFSFKVDGTDQKLELTLRQLGSLDSVNIGAIAKRVSLEINPVIVGGKGQVIGDELCQLIGAIVMAQVGAPEDHYSEGELALLMAKQDSLVMDFMEASTWVFGGIQTSPPAEAGQTPPG